MKNLPNFYQITDRIGTAGHPKRDDFAAIAGAGFEVVVNLAMHDSDDAIADEGALVSAQGMDYIHMPIPFDAPTAAHLGQFCRLMDALEDRQVLVHCQVNARVSAFMFKYLTLTKSIDEEAATTPILTQWLPHMDDVWKGFLAIEREEIK